MSGPSDPVAAACAQTAPYLKGAWAQLPDGTASMRANAAVLDGLKTTYAGSAEAVATLTDAAGLLRQAADDPTNDETKQALLIMATRLEARGASSDATVPATLAPDQADVVGGAEAAYAEDVKTDQTNDQIAEVKEKVLSALEDNFITQWINQQAALVKTVATVALVGGAVIGTYLGYRALRRLWS